MPEVATEELQAFKAAFFRALAHPVRIRILELLVNGEKNVQELQDALGVEQPVVSQQLAVLRTTNIVAGRKEGVSVRYWSAIPSLRTSSTPPAGFSTTTSSALRTCCVSCSASVGVGSRARPRPTSGATQTRPPRLNQTILRYSHMIAVRVCPLGDAFRTE